jgi:mannitol-specific phosphotransferase system IIBC component
MNESQFNLKVAVQRLGTALSGMVMPNIGGFIAWGLSPHSLFQQVIYPIKLR